MYAPAQLLALIEDRLEELGMSQAQLGFHAFGKADNSAIQSLRKGSSPAIDRLEAMAAAIGWEVYFGPPRQTISGMNEPVAEFDHSNSSDTRTGFSPIPWFEPKLGAGSAPVAFLDSWLSSTGLIIENLAAINAPEATPPGFDSNKTIAVIDQAAPRRGFATWLLKEPNKTTVASVSFDGPDLVIVSATSGTAPRIIRDWLNRDVRPAGKVVWLGLLPQT